MAGTPLSALLTGIQQGQSIINSSKQNDVLQAQLDKQKAMAPFLIQKTQNDISLQNAKVQDIPNQLATSQAEASLKQGEAGYKNPDYYQQQRDMADASRFAKVQSANELFLKGQLTGKELENFQRHADDQHALMMAQINRDKSRSKTTIKDPATGIPYQLDRITGDFTNLSNGQNGNVNAGGMGLIDKNNALTTNMRDQKQKILSYYPEVVGELQKMKDLYVPGWEGDLASTKIGHVAANYIAPGKFGLELTKQGAQRGLLENKIAMMTDKIIQMTGLPKTDESINMIKGSLSPKSGESSISYKNRVNSYVNNLNENLQSLSNFTPSTMKTLSSKFNFNDHELPSTIKEGQGTPEASNDEAGEEDEEE